MATAPKVAVQVVQTLTGGPPVISKFPESASLTAKKGELVYIVAGYVTECSDNPTVILGFLNEDGHDDLVAGKYDIQVAVACPENVFEANVCGAAGVSAVLAKAQFGLVWQLYRDITNSKVYVQVDQPVTNPRVVVWGPAGKDAIGDAYGRVLFQVLGKYCQLSVTS